jgi:hypothetical protein
MNRFSLSEEKLMMLVSDVQDLTRRLWGGALRGCRLPSALEGSLSAALGADLSAVRIHVRPEPLALGALAFAYGDHVVLAPGTYAPESPAGPGPAPTGAAAPPVIQCSKFKPGDKVRFKEGREFAYVFEVTVNQDDDTSKYQVYLVNNNTTVYKSACYDSQIEADTQLPNGTWYQNIHTQTRVRIVSFTEVQHQAGQQRQNATKKCVSDFSYTVANHKGEESVVNGCYLKGDQPESVTDSTAFFLAVHRRVPLIYLPNDLKGVASNSKGKIWELYKLVYRGDTRPASEVFNVGFTPRESHAAPVFRTVENKKPRFDIHSNTGVCVSGFPEGGCIFPLIEPGAAEKSDAVRLFCALTPGSSIYRTFKFQKKVKKYEQHEDETLVGFVENLLKAREMVVGDTGIAGSDIVGCFEVDRTWNTDDWTREAKLTVKEWTPNLGFQGCNNPSYKELETIIQQKVRERCTETPSFA